MADAGMTEAGVSGADVTGAGAGSVGGVAARAAEVAQAAAGARAWLAARAAEGAQDGAGAQALARTLRGHARRAARLRAAAQRPMAVAVFGASQAGKSYLVNGLATPRGRPLRVAYGAERLDFMRQINPEGDKEATGLVSRFTLRPPPTSADLPVPLRLLSQTDVVKILANTYLEDFNADGLPVPEAETVQALLAGLEARAAPQPGWGLDLDDMEELQEHLKQTLGSKPLLLALAGAGYWQRATELLPRLPPEARAEAFSPLWNGTKALTAAAAELIRGLARLGFAREASCGTGALVPREPGILNVDILFGLGKPGAPLLQLATPDGARAELPRPVVAALTAELVVPLAERPWDFFEHTDLLDFPGARTREDISDPDAFLAKPDGLGSAFIRGKVAYLYQRYNAEQEITAMLLCVGPSNNEVQTLPRMIRTWIDQTAGDTPAKRARQRNPLFLVLTKFDTHFEDKEGADIESGQQWTARLDASLLRFFGKDSAWPREWTPGRPFGNTQWLRSTTVKFRAVMAFGPPGPDGSEQELGIAPGQAPKVEARKAAYLRNEAVRAHIADPERAWDEALRPEDGGVSYLAERLRPVCDPALKQEQLLGQAEALAADMAAHLRPFWRSGDAGEALRQAEERADTLLDALVGCVERQSLLPLIRALQLTTDDVLGVYWRAQSQPGAAPTIGTASSASRLRDRLRLSRPAGGGEGEDAAPRDRFDHLADLALQRWSTGMADLAASAAVRDAYGLAPEQAAVLVAELGLAARRLGLRARMAEWMRRDAGFTGRGASAAQRPVLVMEAAINGFVHTLGYGEVPPGARPRAGGGERAVFAPRPALLGLPRLGPAPAPYDDVFQEDWLTALRHVVLDGARDPASGGVDPEANAALGRVLALLERRAA